MRNSWQTPVSRLQHLAKMKIFTALLGLLTVTSVVTAITDNQDLEKRQLGAILRELGQAIESAVDCAGCQVRTCTSPT
jgi:hypothetical protein